jgi:hypothetical protein
LTNLAGAIKGAQAVTFRLKGNHQAVDIRRRHSPDILHVRPIVKMVADWEGDKGGSTNMRAGQWHG